MGVVAATDVGVVRTQRGLTLAGTRITLYDVMDYLKAGWSADRIRDIIGLTDQQMIDALDYIQLHSEEVEADYKEVLQAAEKSRQYWEERNRNRLAEIAKMPPKPEREAMWKKLQEWKARITVESQD